ncbi:GNAT family N-acetyltransferase [Akkermansia sp.]|uniref:GNAT family N-acetyltransferase n=1 Tax=Akkermansia TaxID=239934 RepID=UPI0025C1422B|nr:GNAT family N-acetyltransferase [Akkermansia sp.]
MNTLEVAQLEDCNMCNHMIRMGREFQREQGFVQWTDDYPNEDTIRNDIKSNKGYVMKINGVIAGYMCIDFDGEPAYRNIQGKWRTEGPYAVIHRMAFDKGFRGMGLTGTAFKLIEKLCIQNGVRTIRVDTDFPNERMQHILKKNGFENCGTIMFQGSGKLAYDKSF